MKFFKKVKKIFSDKNKVRFELENFYLLLRCYKQIELQKSFLYNREKDINKPSILLIVSSLGYTGGTESRLKKYIKYLKQQFNIFLLLSPPPPPVRLPIVLQ